MNTSVEVSTGVQTHTEIHTQIHKQELNTIFNPSKTELMINLNYLGSNPHIADMLV